jgi:hypothetical protein
MAVSGVASRHLFYPYSTRALHADVMHCDCVVVVVVGSRLPFLGHSKAYESNARHMNMIDNSVSSMMDQLRWHQYVVDTDANQWRAI